MTGRVVSAEEAQFRLDHPSIVVRTLAHTVVVQAEQIDGLKFLIAAIAQDWGSKCCDDPDDCACTMGQAIRLARSLGVTA